jgi:hypothetical protein
MKNIAQAENDLTYMYRGSKKDLKEWNVHRELALDRSASLAYALRCCDHTLSQTKTHIGNTHNKND